MPLRKTPVVSSTAAISSIRRLVKTFRSSSIVVNSMCIWPDEASCVSRCGKPASSGVSLMRHQSTIAQNTMMTAGMKNTAQVASTDWPSSAKMFWIVRWSQPSSPVGLALVMAAMAAPQSNAK